MSNEKPITREFLAYLVAYAVDRLVTQIYNSATEGDMRLCSYHELREQGEVILEEFEPKEDK